MRGQRVERHGTGAASVFSLGADQSAVLPVGTEEGT
jgi:hypothetical protein